MTKLHYTDPLYAAIMARDFGVKLLSRNADEQMREYDLKEKDRFFDWFDGHMERDVETIGDAIDYISTAGDKIYVAPESLDIFTPLPTDKTKIVTIKDDTGETIGFREEITERDGKRFFMPELTKGEQQ